MIIMTTETKTETKNYSDKNWHGIPESYIKSLIAEVTKCKLKKDIALDNDIDYKKIQEYLFDLNNNVIGAFEAIRKYYNQVPEEAEFFISNDYWLIENSKWSYFPQNVLAPVQDLNLAISRFDRTVNSYYRWLQKEPNPDVIDKIKDEIENRASDIIQICHSFDKNFAKIIELVKKIGKNSFFDEVVKVFTALYKSAKKLFTDLPDIVKNAVADFNNENVSDIDIYKQIDKELKDCFSSMSKINKIEGSITNAKKVKELFCAFTGTYTSHSSLKDISTRFKKCATRIFGIINNEKNNQLVKQIDKVLEKKGKIGNMKESLTLQDILDIMTDMGNFRLFDNALGTQRSCISKFANCMYLLKFKSPCKILIIGGSKQMYEELMKKTSKQWNTDDQSLEQTTK